MDENNNKNDMFDLGSVPVEVDFNPFGDGFEDDEEVDNVMMNTPNLQELVTKTSVIEETTAETTALVSKTKETEKPPVFEYAGATENIDDVSKTFDELRIEKSTDFPELEDGKRVSWTVEYGKITKIVADPKGMSVGKMKSDIEMSKDFLDTLKKSKDKNPVCKIKPRVTAQSKGIASAYKGVFTNMDEAKTAGKTISIVPGKDGKVYEIRNTKVGQFSTPVMGCELLDHVRAGFIPALPLIPMDLMMMIVALFKYYMCNGDEQEVLVNVYWDMEGEKFIIDVPEQTVTKVSVNSKTNDYYAIDRYIHYMDIHSHNSMNAFFSSIDDKDECATRLYSVIGNLHEYFPDIKTRISNGGKFLEIDPAEVFELVAKPFPDEWKDNVHFKESHIDDKDGVLCNLDGEVL